MEIEVIDYLTGDLKRAVENVWEAAEEIWAVPKHKYYTDHGVEHSKRILIKMGGLIHGIMNGDHPLSPYEIYILCVATYLHDIGMQNERFQDGDLERIRKVHEKISYEMIIGSSQESEDFRTLNLLPDPDIIEAVGLVALGHRKTKIESDSRYNEFTFADDIIRPRLLSALLRFGDSLDIDHRRVIMENLKLANISAESLYHWHRCYYVAGVSVKNEFIDIHFRIPQGNNYKNLIIFPLQQEIEKELNSLSGILRQSGAKISVACPNIRYLNHIKKMPHNVLKFAQSFSGNDILDNVDVNRIAIDKLVNELTFWLNVIGYNIDERRRKDENCTQLVAYRTDNVIEERVLIHCIEGEVNVLNVQFLEKELLKKSFRLGWTVCDKRIGSSARQRASENEDIKVLTVADIVNKIFYKYHQYLDSLIEDTEISSYYVDLSCEKPIYNKNGKEIARDTYKTIDEYIDNWLEERGKNQISVLGGFGTGKTWFCRHFAYRQFQRFLKSPTSQRLPLLINLRDYRSVEIEQLITDLLVNRYHILINGYKGFEALNLNERLLIIFDGFDEMAMQVDDIVTINNFNALARIAMPGSKVLLTCRTPYFRNYLESCRVLSGGLGEGQAIKRPNFEIVYLCEFSKQQIKKVLKKRVPSKWEDFWLKIKKIYDLPNLAQRPVMLDMIIMTLPELENQQLIDHAMLYKTYTGKCIKKAIDEKRSLLDDKTKLFFTQEVAWEMFKQGVLTVTSEKIQELIKCHLKFTLKNPESIIFLEHDCRNASFISRRDELGNYEFIHRSFMEFFVAQKLAEAIKNKLSDPLKEQEIYYEIIRFLNQMIDPISDSKTLTKWRDDKSMNSILRTNCIRISGQWTSQDNAIKLIKMIKDTTEESSHRRDAIRSAIRVFHGEEADWDDTQVKMKLHAFAIRTGRDDLNIECLPIEIKILNEECIPSERLNLCATYINLFTEALSKCFNSKQTEPDEIRINASYAMIHFAKSEVDQTLLEIAQHDTNEYVRFNCYTALMSMDSVLSKIAMQQILGHLKKPELKTLATTNLESIKNNHPKKE